MTVSHTSERITEAILVFGVIFLPGYLYQTSAFDQALLFDAAYNLRYLVSSIPHIGLLLFLIMRRKESERYGLVRPDCASFLGIIPLAAILVAISLTTSLAGTATDTTSPPATDHAAISAATIPVVLLAAVCTGYREELFFRSMLPVALEAGGRSQLTIVILCSLLFAAGHLYQGPVAFLGTGLIAAVLHLWFFRFGSIHVLALGHALYNIVVLFSRLAVT